MKKALNDKQKLAAYVLNKDPDMGNHSTAKIGEFFNVSQSTAYNAVKDVDTARQIQNLKNELAAVKKDLIKEKTLQDKPKLINVTSKS